MLYLEWSSELVLVGHLGIGQEGEGVGDSEFVVDHICAVIINHGKFGTIAPNHIATDIIRYGNSAALTS